MSNVAPHRHFPVLSTQIRPSPRFLCPPIQLCLPETLTPLTPTDLVTRRSFTGLVFMFCGGPIAYKSQIQSTVSTSSTEAEFIAAVHAAKIAKYLRSILSDLGYPTIRAYHIVRRQCRRDPHG